MGRFYRGGPVMMSALSGIDIALWDIRVRRSDRQSATDLQGKELGVPVWSLLGGLVRNKCKVYVSDLPRCKQH